VSTPPTTGNIYDAAVQKLREGDRPPAFAEGFSSNRTLWEATDLVVDLDAAFKKALDNQAEGLQVFADRVLVPKGFARTLGDRPYRLTVIARHMEAEDDSAVLRLKDSGRDAETRARLLLGGLSGRLKVSPSDGGTGAQSTEVTPSPDLRYAAFALRKPDGPPEGRATLVPEATAIQLELLDEGKPLHRLLTASYRLAVELIGEGRRDTAGLRLARSILVWLSRWATYPSVDLIPVFEAAHSLLRTLPSPHDTGHLLTYSVPARTPAGYLARARDQKELAALYENSLKFDSLGADLRTVTAQVITSWSRRDGTDLVELDERIKRGAERVEKAQEAVQEAARDLDQQKFYLNLDQNDLELQSKLDQIDKIVSATFEVASGVLQLGIGVASACFGNPTAMASGVRALNPVPLFQMVKNANHASTLEKGLKTFLAWEFAGLIPGYLKNFQDLDPKHREAFVDAVKTAFTNIAALTKSVTALVNSARGSQPETGVNKTEVGALVSKMATATDPNRAKADWDSFLADVRHPLDKIVNDPKAAGGVKDAAGKYRATVEKIAIYGRLMAEQQAVLAEAVCELGNLLLRKAAVAEKRSELERLTSTLQDDQARLDRLQQQAAIRLRDVGQAFAATMEGFRSACFYESLGWPAVVTSLPGNAREMQEACGKMAEALTEVDRVAKSRGQIKSTTIEFDGKDILDGLRKTGEAKIEIRVGHAREFKDYDLVRIESLRPWLVGATTKDGKTPIHVKLSSAALFSDRRSDDTVDFSGQPCTITFKYGADNKPVFEDSFQEIQPTPFSTWTVRIMNEKNDVNLGYDLQLMSWGDGSNVPTSGQDLVIAGTDNFGLLHIRTFDAAGARTDTFETRDNRGASHFVSADASGKALSDKLESNLSTTQAGAIATLKHHLPVLLPPHVLSEAERDQVLSQATLITDPTRNLAGRMTTLKLELVGRAKAR
jgi:hypothetical protein